MSILFVDKVITEILSNTFFSNEIVFSPKFSAITCLAKSIFPCAISFFINSSISISLSVFLKVTTELSGFTSSDDKKPVAQIYRVRKSWSDSKSQIGAYKVLDNAKKKVDANAGYKVFDTSGNIVYPAAGKPTQTPVANTFYKVQIDIANLNIRKGPGTNNDKTGQFTGKGIFTIVQEAKGEGATLCGKLKSGAGWISLDFAKKL